jgi:epoxyqueuosine reductase
MTLSHRIRAEALNLGFDLVGIAAARRALTADAFRTWLDRRYHGEMAWLGRDPERRADPRKALPEARSVVMVGVSYFVRDPDPEVWNDPLRGRVARYAWGRDYHKVIESRLHSLGEFIRREVTQDFVMKAYVDYGPILERDAAAQAGLGFVGKNTLLISPRLGSYTFLAEILLSLDLEPDPPFVPADADGPEDLAELTATRGTCGSCTRCQTVCPTHAFPAAWVLDSNRCISYLTIEHRGDLPEALRPKMGRWVFGCDECQSVCPWVKQFSAPSSRPWLAYDPEWAAPSLEGLLALDEAGFQARFQGTPLRRPKRVGLLRNAVVALANGGHPHALAVAERAARDPDPMVARHAAWAAARLRRPGDPGMLSSP